MFSMIGVFVLSLEVYSVVKILKLLKIEALKEVLFRRVLNSACHSKSVHHLVVGLNMDQNMAQMR